VSATAELVYYVTEFGRLLCRIIVLQRIAIAVRACAKNIGAYVQGMRRMYADIDDISVDVPSAVTLLEQLVSKLKLAGTLSEDLAAELPSRLE